MGSVNNLLVVAIIVLGVGLILHIVGMATPAWSTTSNYVIMPPVTTTYELGPFQFCVGGSCTDTDTDGMVGELADSINAVKAMTIIGCLLAAAAAGLVVYMIVAPVMGSAVIKVVPRVTTGLSVFAFVIILIGVIIWGAKVHDDLYGGIMDIGYSFALSIVGGFFVLIGGIIAYIGGNKVAPE